MARPAGKCQEQQAPLAKSRSPVSDVQPHQRLDHARLLWPYLRRHADVEAVMHDQPVASMLLAVDTFAHFEHSQYPLRS
jgi:hypothetical protein